MADPVDLTPPQAIHIVGIGGAGMSAIASVLASMGHRVSGSDLKASKALERLEDQGLRVAVGHRADQIEDATVRITLSAGGHRAGAEPGVPSRRGHRGGGRAAACREG